MANTDARVGLKPVGHLLGLDWSARLRKCYIPSTDSTRAMFIGDAVTLAGASDATGRYATVTPATVGATNVIYGVIAAFEPDPTDLTLMYRKDDTSRYCYVIFDPYVIYEIQGDSAAAVASTSVGLNSVLIATHSGDTVTGLSGLELNSSVVAADATYQLHILGAAPYEDNDISLVNAKWHVIINLHGYRAQYDAHASAWYGSLGV